MMRMSGYVMAKALTTGTVMATSPMAENRVTSSRVIPVVFAALLFDAFISVMLSTGSIFLPFEMRRLEIRKLYVF